MEASQQKHSSVDLSAGLDYYNLNLRHSLKSKARNDNTISTFKNVKGSRNSSCDRSVASRTSSQIKNHHSVNHDLLLADVPDYGPRKKLKNKKSSARSRCSKTFVADRQKPLRTRQSFKECSTIKNSAISTPSEKKFDQSGPQQINIKTSHSLLPKE